MCVLGGQNREHRNGKRRRRDQDHALVRRGLLGCVHQWKLHSVQLLSSLHICPHHADRRGIRDLFVSVNLIIRVTTSNVQSTAVRLCICVVSSQPSPESPFLEWLNRLCVIVGLFFFGLAIFTFLLCSWNPKINNTARLHLCLSLSLSHLLLLWNDRYVEDEVESD